MKGHQERRHGVFNGLVFRPAVSVSLLMLFLAGCSIHALNQTPEAFPYCACTPEDYPPDDVLKNSTLSTLHAMQADNEHRFMLEVTADPGISNISAYVTVDGVEHSMHQGPGALWTYETEGQCRGGYDYSFRVRYRRFGYSTPYNYRIAEDNPYHVGVRNWGDVTFQAGNYPITNYQYPTFMILTQSDNTGRAVVQNLTTSTITIYKFGVVDTGPPLNVRPEEFEVLDAPPEASSDTPAEGLPLACGEQMVFNVRWNGTNPGAAIAFVMYIDGTIYGTPFTHPVTVMTQ